MTTNDELYLMGRNTSKGMPRLRGKIGMRAVGVPSLETMKELVKSKEEKLAAKRKFAEVKPEFNPGDRKDDKMSFAISCAQLQYTTRSKEKGIEEYNRKMRGEKRVRGEIEEVRQRVFQEFGTSPRWTLQGLATQLAQPEVFLREIVLDVPEEHS